MAHGRLGGKPFAKSSAHWADLAGFKSGQTLSIHLYPAGFIAKNNAGQVTTLKRNGSDYSATILGALFRVRIVDWTVVLSP